MPARTSALRISLAFLLAPVGAIALCYLLATGWLLTSGEPLHLDVASTLRGIMLFAFVGSPIAYVVEAILLLALGVRPPPGWRGLATTVAIGMLSGALTLGALAHFSEHVIGEGLAWFSGAGAVIGGSAACVYVLIVVGVPRAKPAMRGSIG